MFQLERQRTRQPQWGARIDWSNPITKGLVFAAVGGFPINVVNNSRGTLVGSAKSGIGAPGRVFETINAEASRVDFINTVRAVGGERSFFSLFSHTGIDTNTFQYLINRDTVTNLFMIRYYSSGNYRLQITWAALGLIVSTEQVSANAWHSGSASTPPADSASNSTAALWLDRKKLTIASDVTPFDSAVSATGTADVILSGRTADNIRSLGGKQALSLSWNRVLSDREHASMHNNPWQIFQPRRMLIGATVQTARPIADLSNTGWVPSSGADLYPMVGETVRDDGTYIAATAVGAICELDLADLADPAASTGHLPTLVLSAPGGGGITIRLRQGTTTIATWTYHPGATPTEYTPALSGAEADSITDYTALRLQFEAIA